MLIVLLQFIPFGVFVLLVYFELHDCIFGLALDIVVIDKELLIPAEVLELLLVICLVPILLSAYDIFKFASGGFD